jgi:2-polyprenyl-3-methyl-5-hydroxy-6-metoxy-1,4-benzoquinol methylase
MRTASGLSLPGIESESHRVPHCEICKNTVGNKIHVAREMMLGLRELFQYLECQACGCLQLINPPEDMSRYYPANYTAFGGLRQLKFSTLQGLRDQVRKRRNEGFFGKQSWLDRCLTNRYENLQLRAFAGMGLDRKARILDVGCGSGILVADLRELGYENVLGLDLFIPRTLDDGNRVRVVKGELQDLTGTNWDVIMFHHSFEHMPNPSAVLRVARNLLNPGGHCLIRIPVLGWAWQHYGVHWAQLDAPRHLFLHTVKSFRLLVEAVGLEVCEVSYDSNELQFWVSELYSKNIDLASVGSSRRQKVFSRSKMQDFKTRARRLNIEGQADSAVFKLKMS